MKFVERGKKQWQFVIKMDEKNTKEWRATDEKQGREIKVTGVSSHN